MNMCIADGGYPSGCLGRQTTPGHAIEAGWFLLEEAAARYHSTFISILCVIEFAVVEEMKR